MSVGLLVVKSDVDRAAGTFARDLRSACDHVTAFKEWLDTQLVADLVTLGYTTGEANILKSAYSDAQQLVDIYRGVAALAVAKDFRTFMKSCYGLGNVPL